MKLILSALLFVATLHAQNVLSLTGPPNAIPGVAFTVGLSYSASSVAIAQWTAAFVLPSGSTVTSAIGSSGVGASKTITCIAGGIRCVVYGMNTNLMAAGPVATYIITLPASATGSVTVSLSNLVAVSANSDVIASSVGPPLTIAIQSAPPPPPPPPPPGTSTYTLGFSTYLGGNQYEQIRDITTDASGNIYVVGGTGSSNFPRTQGQVFAGNLDAFVTKLSPAGQILWSVLLGGPNYDRAYAIELDAMGNIYIAGRAGPGFPLVAPFQSGFAGYVAGLYGSQNAFVAKLNPAGTVLWSSYFGTGDLIRDMDIDAAGNMYVVSNYQTAIAQAVFPSAWTANGFQKTPQGSSDLFIAKINTSGASVAWGTYLGGSAAENAKASLRVDHNGDIIVLTDSASSNIPVLNAHQATRRGGTDAYVAKLKPDGSGILWATYFGGTLDERNETHHLAIDNSNNVYIGMATLSSDLPTTAGTYQRTYGGAGTAIFHAIGDAFVTKFSPSGQMLLSTYVGGSNGDGPQGLATDAAGNVYFSGGTASANYPVTPGAALTTKQAGEDVIATRLSANFTKLDYSTFLGNSSNDEGRVVHADQNGNFYVGCETSANGFTPLKNALQSSFGGGTHDACLAKFSVVAGTPLPAPLYDLNSDGVTNGADVALAVDQALGTCGSANVNGDGVCNVSDVMLIVRAALGLQ